MSELAGWRYYARSVGQFSGIGMIWRMVLGAMLLFGDAGDLRFIGVIFRPAPGNQSMSVARLPFELGALAGAAGRGPSPAGQLSAGHLTQINAAMGIEAHFYSGAAAFFADGIYKGAAHECPKTLRDDWRSAFSSGGGLRPVGRHQVLPGAWFDV